MATTFYFNMKPFSCSFFLSLHLRYFSQHELQFWINFYFANNDKNLIQLKLKNKNLWRKLKGIQKLNQISIFTFNTKFEIPTEKKNKKWNDTELNKEKKTNLFVSLNEKKKSIEIRTIIKWWDKFKEKKESWVFLLFTLWICEINGINRRNSKRRVVLTKSYFQHYLVLSYSCWISYNSYCS